MIHHLLVGAVFIVGFGALGIWAFGFILSLMAPEEFWDTLRQQYPHTALWLWGSSCPFGPPPPWIGEDE